MAKTKSTNRRDQTVKGRAFNRSTKMVELRRSNASGFHTPGKFEREDFRKIVQSGRFDLLEDMD